jgi:diguanylate cyclase (GGDEF)-like protein/PAS domain S-box-containing protein
MFMDALHAGPAGGGAPALDGLDLLGLVQDLDAILWAYDPAADRFTFVSEHAERMLGHPAADWVDAAFWAGLMHPDDRDAAVAYCLSETAAGRDHDFEYRALAADGREVVVRDMVRLVRDAEGAVAGLRGVMVDVTDRRRDAEELARLGAIERTAAQEQAAMRRVAVEVARGVGADRIMASVARECAGLLGTESAIVARFEPDEAVVVATFGTHSAVGERLPTVGDGALARVARTGAGALIADYASLPPDAPLRAHALAHGYRASVAAPVEGAGRLWGAVLATTKDPAGLPGGAMERLASFAELVALAVANAAARTELHLLATTDTLTGLANRRAFEERMAEEVERAVRHARPLSLVLLDLDHFKHVNDAHGHPVGDRVLAEIAGRLRLRARAGDTLARMGGEELAWLMPETEGADALRAAERLRAEIEGEVFGGEVAVTVSGGVCDLAAARGAPELYRLADEALYWAKGHGRNQMRRYSAAMAARTEEAAARQRAAERGQAVRGVRALARAVDAKDPSTRRHSERVADLCARVATALGWDGERVAALSEAALVHDVGKIGVPDAILLKQGVLTPAEYEVVKNHATLGALIAADVLTPEQSAWVRHHHERWDGRGYPDGLAGDDIPLGAQVIAAADAMDVMCSTRIYAAQRPPAEALGEMRRQAGRQFAPAVVAALERLAEMGALGDAEG